MAVANANAVKYAELTDEQIVDIKRRVEMFVKSEEYWDKFANHSTVARGHRTFASRRVIAPKVNPAELASWKRAEFVAPRPTKIAVATFERTVDNYGDKAIYSREDLQYHFDDTVDMIAATLKEIVVQKKDVIKGHAFLSSKALVSYDTSILKTAENAAIILRKNKAKRWANGLFLAHITPEGLRKLRAEIAALGQTLDEKTKVKLGEGLESVGQYGDFMYSVTTSELMYESDKEKYIVFMGRRGIDGASPVDVAKLEGESDIELINNPLGSGVLLDVDGNYTSDDNKQQGSIAVNMDGLGADVTDDLCILVCNVAAANIGEIKGTGLAEAEKSLYVSHSGNEHEVTLTTTNLTHAHYDIVGGRYDSSASKWYASGNTIVAVKVVADDTYTLGAVTASNWSANYKLVNGGDDIAAEVIGIVTTTKSNDTLIVRVPDKCYSFTVATTATAS